MSTSDAMAFLAACFLGGSLSGLFARYLRADR